MVIPGPGLPRLGSFVETMANRSPLGSQENSVTVSENVVGMKRRCVEGHTFQFDNFNWVILLANAEDFKVAEDRFLGLGVSVDLDTKEVALVLPEEFTLAE